MDYSAYHWSEKARKYAESIPTVNDATITVTQGGVTKGTFTLNQSSNGTIALDSGGSGTDLPDQTGHSGEYLTTDGTSARWGAVSIPTVNNATLKIQKNGTDVATFTANSSTNSTANITVPTQASDIGAQETLVSGTNIKTINSTTILGSGNIDTLPIQTGNNGKYLTTNGTSASWAVPKTFNLFDHKWEDYLLNDQSWLRADTFSWQDGTVYSNAYQHLVADLESSKKMFYGWISGNPLDLSNYYTLSATPSVGDAIYSVENNTSADSLTTIASISGTTIVGANGVSYFSNAPETRELYLLSKDTIGAFDVYYYLASDGHKIVAALNEEDVSDVYDEFGVAWYYILDTTNQRFKLPITRYDFVGLRDAVGKYVPETLPNITGSADGGIHNGSQSSGTSALYYNSIVSNSYTGHASSSGNYGSNIKIDASRTSSTYQNGAPVQQRATQMYLYFYVGQFSQSATEQTAGLNAELFNEKADINLNNAAPNASSTAKEIIVSWREPDYSSGTSVSLNNTFTPTKDGVIEYKVYCATGAGSGFWICEDNTNGRKLSGMINAASAYIHTANQLSVVAGKKYYIFSSSATVEYINFYPYKGA